MNEPLLKVDGLQVHYGQAIAVGGISFSVQAGEIVTLVGANGAGKSSTLYALSGIKRAAAGEVRFAGETITRLPAHAIVKRGLVQVPEGRMIFTSLTVEENLQIGAYAQLNGDPQRKGEVLSLFPALSERLTDPAAHLSGGQMQMLALARGLMAKPTLLLLDEPSLGLSPIAVRDVFALVARLRQLGLTVLLVEQNVRQALAIADRAYILESGRIAMQGNAQDLLHDDHLISTYLGVAPEKTADG